MNKPPLGLKPKFIHDYERMEEIIEAMERYSKTNISIPLEWIDELKQLFKLYLNDLTYS